MRSLTPPYNVAECDGSMEDNSLYGNSTPMACLPSCVEEENRENDYHTLKPMGSPYDDDDNDETDAWTKKHPDSWEHTEVLAWLNYVAFVKLDISQMHLEKFQACSGRQLREMTKEEFLHHEPQYGDLIHTLFWQMIDESQYNAPEEMDTYTPHPAPHNDLFLDILHGDDFDPQAFDPLSFDLDLVPQVDLPLALPQRTSSLSESSGYCTDGSTGDNLLSDSMSPGSSFSSTLTMLSPCDPHQASSPSQMTTLPPMDYFLGPPSMNNNNNNNNNVDGYPDMNIPSVVQNHAHISDYATPPSKVAAMGKVSKRGRPRKVVEDCNGTPVKSHRGRKQATKGSHLWEFVRDLLLDPEHNPSVIRWEDRTHGVFRFVNSERVAKMWGQRKNNNTMTYEKLSRAMRHYYKNHILLPVLGRRLVYQFGPLASGWRSYTNTSDCEIENEQQQQQHQAKGEVNTETFADAHSEHQPMQQLYHRQHEQLQRSMQNDHPQQHNHQHQHQHQQYHQQQQQQQHQNHQQQQPHQNNQYQQHQNQHQQQHQNNQYQHQNHHYQQQQQQEVGGLYEQSYSYQPEPDFDLTSSTELLDCFF